MPEQPPISDMHVFPLTREDGRLVLLREADHLLRRFGQLDLLDLAAGSKTEFALRAEADRFLFPIAGDCRVELIDLREASPTRGRRASLQFSALEPQGVLVPFGVACSLQAEAACRLIALATHAQPHPGDRAASADELQAYSALQ
jgi:hypothetical protein